MKLTKDKWFRASKWMGMCLIAMNLACIARAQAVTTTTVQGTVYLANGTPSAGTLQLSWPAFTTVNNQTITAGRTTVTIGADGFVSVNLAPNLGSSPAGLFYTAVYHLSDGTTSTEYWVVPAAAQASLAQVRAQVMPAAQAVQAVDKAYVDQAIQLFAQTSLSPSGGTLSGPLYLSGDPSQALQAADKHYVDSTFSQAVPLTGASLTGPLTSVQLGAAYQVDQFPGADFGAKLQACLASVSSVYGGTCDARNFTGNLSMASNLTISTANTTILLPCATISTASQLIVAAGTRNVALRGCALRGASNASGSQGGTVFLYSGTGAMVQVGDPTYAADTLGFHLDNAVINTTAASSSAAQALAAYRTQELDLQSLYLLGNSNQTGMTLDGTGNYAGGTFYDIAINGFQTAVDAIGHQVSNPATTDWLNASTFVRLHIDCPTSGGSPVNGTYGINLQQGDGNTFTGGDVEGCGTALHLGSNAQNNTIVGLRNENSNNQIVADAGSSYNNWMTGGTMFTGKLTDNGTRNSFLDTFHRSFNGMNGDWYGSQQDATVTNHLRLGVGTGNERGLLNRYQTDFGYRWTTGLSDATAGEQFYQILDELNNVYRLSIGQYNNGQPSTNNQTVINAAGTGSVVLNGSNNSGTGGVVIGSGGPSVATVATINNAGNAQFNGTLQVGGVATFTASTTVRNQADAEIDSILTAGATTNQKESFTYKDYTGASQWYMVKDPSNNWALNSAIGGLDSFKAYQSNNSGDTYINASSPSGVVRVNYENGAGTGFNIYGGNSSTLYASITGTTSIKLPGLAAGSGHNCLQIDNSGYVTNTGSGCGSGGGGGTVNSGASGQIAYYSGSGTALSGMSTIPVTAGGTGASSVAGALTALGGASLTSTSTQNFAGPINFGSSNAASTTLTNLGGAAAVSPLAFGAKCDAVWVSNTNTYTGTDDRQAFLAMLAYMQTSGQTVVQLPAGKNCRVDPPGGIITGFAINGNVVTIQMNNSLVTGDIVTPEGLSAGTYLNGVPLVVLSTGLSSTQFEAMFYHANIVSTTDSGYGPSSALEIVQGGLVFSGNGGSEAQGATSVASISAGAHGSTASVGPFVQWSYDKSAGITSWTRDGAGNLTINFAAMPGGLVFDAGRSIVVSNTGTIDATYNSITTATSTQITITGVSGSAASGAGGLLHEPWSNASWGGIKGSEWNDLTLANYSRVNQVECTATGLGQYCYYVPWTYGFLDYKGGSQILNNVAVKGVQYGFFGIQSDFTHLNNMSFNDGSVGIYVGPSSDPFYVDGYDDTGDDTSIWFDGVGSQGVHVSHSHFRSGSNLYSQVTIANKQYDVTACCGGGLASDAIVLQDDNFEFGACYSSAVPSSFISVDKDTSAHTASDSIHIIRPSVINSAKGNSCNVPDLVDVGSAGAGGSDIPTITIDDPSASTATLTNFVNNLGTQAPNALVINANAAVKSAVTSLANSGSGVGKSMYAQVSDGTGTSGNLAKYAADGSLTNGPAPPAGTIVGTTDTQTLTNKTLTSPSLTTPKIGGTTISNVPIMTWSNTAGGYSSQYTGQAAASFTPVFAVTIRRFQMFYITTGAGCTTAPVIAVYDSTTSATLASFTISNGTGTFDSGTVSASVAAGDVLQVRYTTAAAGCTTLPSNDTFTVQYQMQ